MNPFYDMAGMMMNRMGQKQVGGVTDADYTQTPQPMATPTPVFSSSPPSKEPFVPEQPMNFEDESIKPLMISTAMGGGGGTQPWQGNGGTPDYGPMLRGARGLK
jgi:hypothetical protein